MFVAPQTFKIFGTKKSQRTLKAATNCGSLALLQMRQLAEFCHLHVICMVLHPLKPLDPQSASKRKAHGRQAQASAAQATVESCHIIAPQEAWQMCGTANGTAVSTAVFKVPRQQRSPTPPWQGPDVLTSPLEKYKKTLDFPWFHSYLQS